MRGFFACGLLLFISSCQKEIISVTNRELRVDRYASYHVGTPDPLLDKPMLGQELRIHQKKSLLDLYHHIELKLFVRYGDLTQEAFVYSIHLPYAPIVFQLMGDSYLSKKGILSYKVEVYGDGHLIDQVYHQLWAEVLILNAPDDDTQR